MLKKSIALTKTDKQVKTAVDSLGDWYLGSIEVLEKPKPGLFDWYGNWIELHRPMGFRIDKK